MLPSKNKKWKKVRICRESSGRYTLIFISPVKDVIQLRKIIEDDIEDCLDLGDRVVSYDLANKSVMLEIADIELFKRRLLYRNIDSEEQG